jgi:hypothetical protein
MECFLIIYNHYNLFINLFSLSELAIRSKMFNYQIAKLKLIAILVSIFGKYLIKTKNSYESWVLLFI